MSANIPFQWRMEIRLGMRLYSQAHNFGGEVVAICHDPDEPTQLVLSRDDDSMQMLVPVTPESGLALWH